jgi:3-phenylpropionate/trans-cinnamate dioxygenase ferredoxin component
MGIWKEVAVLSEFENTDRKLVDLGDEKYIALFKIDGGYFAVDGICSHEKASLVLGEVSDHEVMCPLHGARFDLRTGRHMSLPAVRPVASYPVKIEADKILVELS